MCTGKRDGAQIASTLDCASYFVCDHGVPEIMRCSDNLLYDEKLNVCNWAENVACGQLQKVCKEYKLFIQCQFILSCRILCVEQQPPATAFEAQDVPQGVAGVPEQQIDAIWTEAPPKPLEEIIPPVLVDNPMHPMIQPEIEKLPEYLLVQGMPEVEGHAENVETIATTEAVSTEEVQQVDMTVMPEEPLPTPPNPSSANQHVFNFHTRPQRPKAGEVRHTFQSLPFFDIQQQSIKPASASYFGDDDESYGMVEFYAGISYDKSAVHSFRCHFDFFYFTPHPLSCSKFIICVNKNAYEHECGSGVYFDYLSSRCALPKEASCFKDNHKLDYDTDHMDVGDADERPDDYYLQSESETDKTKSTNKNNAEVDADVGALIPDFTSDENQGWGDWTPPGMKEEADKWGDDVDAYVQYNGFGPEPKEEDKFTVGLKQDQENIMNYYQPARAPAPVDHYSVLGRLPAPQAHHGRRGHRKSHKHGYDDVNRYAENDYYNGGYSSGNAGFMSVSEHIEEPNEYEVYVPDFFTSTEVVPAVAVEEEVEEKSEENDAPGIFFPNNSNV